LIDIKSGIGKAGADITIIDGWRLGSVKDNSDNTAMLGDLGESGKGAACSGYKRCR